MMLWGESLGSGAVTRLAEGRSDIAAIVLESPFTSGGVFLCAREG